MRIKQFLMAFSAIFLIACFANQAVAGIIFETAAGATVGNGQEANAQAVLTVDVDGNLQILLTNLATSGMGNITRLTNFEFNVKANTDWSLLAPNAVGGEAASVRVNSGSSIIDGFTPNYGSGGDPSDISGGWVFGTNVAPAGFTEVFDYGVSSTAFNSGITASRFDGSTHFGNYTDSFGNNWGPVNGGDWGLIGKDSNGDPVDTYTGPSVMNSVIITLAVDGTLNLSDIETTAYFTYGSERAGVAGMVPGLPPPQQGIPEPASLAIWGLGVLGLAGARRRRKKS